MTIKSKRIVSLIFVILIFLFGLITVWNCRGTIQTIVKERDFLHCKTEIEDSLNKNICLKNQWINANGALHRVMGETIVRGSDGNYDVYKLSNGQIMYNLPKKEMAKYAKKIEEVNDFLSQKNIGFTYVQLPFKIKNSSVMPAGTKDFGNINADRLVDLLEERNIDTINIGEHIEGENKEWSTLFFKTDHHWLPTTGLWASGVIMNHLGKKHDFFVNKDFYKYKNYSSKTHTNWMLGAVGRRVGVCYDGLDDIEILNPKFKTNFIFVGKSDEGTDRREGSFYDSMYLWDNLEERADFINNSYSTYIGKEYSVATVENRLSTNNKRILWIRDSFSCVLTPFISLNVKETINIDFRRCKKSLSELCEEYKPDFVVIAYNPSAFSEKQFNFFKEK